MAITRKNITGSEHNQNLELLSGYISEIYNVLQQKWNLWNERPYVSVCDKFIKAFIDSWDINLMLNTDLILEISELPEEPRTYLLFQIVKAQAEIAQEKELNKDVIWVMDDTIEAVNDWVELTASTRKLSFEQKLQRFGKKCEQMFWGMPLDFVNNCGYTFDKDRRCITIELKWQTKAIFPLILPEELQSKSWTSIMSFNWLDYSLVTSTDFIHVLDWLKEIKIKSPELQAAFFKGVLWLEDGIYLCADLQADGQNCNAYQISDRWVDFTVVWKGIQNLNHRALTS